MKKYKILATLAMIISLILLALISSESKPGNHDTIKMNKAKNVAYSYTF